MTVTTPAGPPGVRVAAALEVDHLEVTYKVRGKERLALRDISFAIGTR